jgi:hypothetical protein
LPLKQIAAALKKAEIDIPVDTKAKLSACFASSGVIPLANAIKDTRALTSLNLASNNLGAEGAKIVAEAIKVAKCTPAIILYHFHVHLISPSTAVVCYYPQDMGAMTKFDISSNDLCSVSAKIVRRKIQARHRPHILQTIANNSSCLRSEMEMKMVPC